MKDLLSKTVGITVSVIMLASVSIGCENDTKKETTTIPDGNLDSCTLRVSWWGGDDRHEATIKAIELWNEKYPNIKIEPEYGGWDGWDKKINTQVTGNTAPDIMQINYDWLVNLSNDGLGFYDLNQLTKHLDLTGYDDTNINFGMIDGKLNALTVSMSGRGLFYNSKVYQELGVEMPKTWDELIALGKTFNSVGKYPLDLDTQSGATAWYLSVVYIQQTTGKHFITMNGDLGVTADDIKIGLDFYKTLEDNGVIRTVKERLESDGNAALYQTSSFIDGDVAGVLEWGSAVGKYEAVLDEKTLVAGDYLGNSEGNFSGWMIKPSFMYAISDETKYPDESAAFLNFILNDPECAEILGTTRGIPTSSYAYDALVESDKLYGVAYESDVMLSENNPIMISPYMELAQLKEYYNIAIEKVSYGTATTEEVANEMYTNIINYLEKIK